MKKELTTTPSVVECKEGRIFTRVITKPFAKREDQRIVVTELDGVFVYFAGDTVIVSKEEIYAFD